MCASQFDKMAMQLENDKDPLISNFQRKNRDEIDHTCYAWRNIS